MSKNSSDRFKEVYTQGVISRTKIIVDTKTGVNYIFVSDGYAGGLTVLLDSAGKPVITTVEPQYY